MLRANTNADVGELVGAVVTGVRYFQLAYSTEEGSWERSANQLHIVDHGIDLVTEATCFRFTWERGQSAYHLSVRAGSMVDDLLSATMWSVGTEEPWETFIGRSIVKATLHWLEFDDSPGSGTSPVAATLAFDDEAAVAVAVATHIADEDRLLLGGDELAIVWKPHVIAHLLPIAK